MLFISETPNRFYPIKSHTTGLPLINYLPPALAFRATQRFSQRYVTGDSWADLLRKGIRGSTVGEVLSILRQLPGGRPALLQPHQLGLRSSIDLWYRISSERGLPTGVAALKHRAKRLAFTALWQTFHVSAVPSLTLAIRKRAA